MDTNHKLGLGGIRWWHRINIPEHGYTEGLVNHGPDGGDWPTKRFGMPEDLSNKNVIDVGCWDGFFSFEAEKRGARQVTASDCSSDVGGNPNGTAGFYYAKKCLNSKVQFRTLNIEKVRLFGSGFDLVLCYGVLYHLKSPLIAMENLSLLTASSGTCLIETAVSEHKGEAHLAYRPNRDGDPTNYFYPSYRWMELAAKEVGFKSVKCIYDMPGRATFRLSK